MNLVHASDSVDSAKRELALYFDDSEFCEYEPVVTAFLRAPDES
jgi:nucleoside-diphosphate kinase